MKVINVGGQGSYVDYIGNLARLAVELVNGEEPAELRREFFGQHQVRPPDGRELGTVLPALRDAVGAVADGGPLEPVSDLLRQFPATIELSDHDGGRHLHFAGNGEQPVAWLGRSCAAALAHVICGDPDLTVRIGRCAAAGCPNFYVDASRNRSRRFCSGACASRTTVAAHRARMKPARS